MAKALLSIMTCPKCGVHEAAMLQAVRSTFHVYLVGKSPAGKELAKRTLVDMLKCVFSRMEAYDIISRQDDDDDTGGGADDGEGEIAAIAIAHSKSGEDDATVGTSATATTSATTNGSVLAAPPSAAGGGDVGLFASQYHTDSYLLFRALCKLSSKTLPGDENVTVPTNAMGGLGGGAGGGVTSSMGGVFFSSAPTVDPLALNSKILSLELILAVFEHCGDAFRNGEKFVYAVKSYLCVSLLKNCMSNMTVVSHLSLKIFLLLVSSCIRCYIPHFCVSDESPIIHHNRSGSSRHISRPR
jgi:brefeldin A-inhibited guanine nucleotide-exchange protein